MVDRRVTRELQDISNLMDPLSTDLAQQSNVFKRLSTSPSKKYPDDITKPAMRLSPIKRSPNKTGTQLTPKRLESPICLKNYVPKITQSMDRPHFSRPEGVQKYEEDGRVTSLVFPSSPTKMTFTSEKKIGGDGSMSKLRSRFSNGLLSPQRLVNSSSLRIQGRNLFTKLEEEDGVEEVGGATESIEKQIPVNMQDRPKIGKTKKQKTVKFRLPTKDVDSHMNERVATLESALSQMMERQKELEERLHVMEQRTGRDNDT